MAPEVAFKKDYQKSVDVWSTGVIMYMLLTGGKHPLYSEEDTADTYKEKLKKVINFLDSSNYFSKYLFFL